MQRNVRHAEGVSIITCTNRPAFFERLIANYKSQRYPVKELIIVLNKDSMALGLYRDKTKALNNVFVYKLPEQFSLGRCLNYAVTQAKFPFIAKFDDDDFYSPYYLTEQMKSIFRTKADIVGKHTYFNYVEARQLLVMRNPNQHNRFVKLVAGATILFNKQVFAAVRFADISLGEDVNFLRRCRAKGYKIYASSQFNFVAVRRNNKMTHTWRVGDDYIVATGRVIARTDRYRAVATRPF